jgi:preprotein translocase subunit SecG
MQILNIFHVLVAIALVGFVLIQKGQGATAGASFGAGASATVFGARGAGTFLTRATWVLAALFCAISLTMAVVVSRTVGVPDTDLGVVADTPAQQDDAADGADMPPATELSVADDEPSTSDLPAFDSGDGEGATDVPEFEAPEGAGAIEGSQVSDEIDDAAESAEDSAGQGEADSGS